MPKAFIRRHLALLVGMLAPLYASAVQLGDPRESVVAELGPPQGEIAAGSRAVLYYPAGEVRLRDGRVHSFQLLEPEALAARQAAEASARERRAAARSEREAQQEAEGRELYQRMRRDAAFRARPAEDQLTFWQQFAARYPEVSVIGEIEALAARIERERQAQLLTEAAAAMAAAADHNRRAGPDRGGYRGRYAGPWRPPIGEPVEATPPAHPMDAARARYMGDFEEGRRRMWERFRD